MKTLAIALSLLIGSPAFSSPEYRLDQATRPDEPPAASLVMCYVSNVDNQPGCTVMADLYFIRDCEDLRQAYARDARGMRRNPTFICLPYVRPQR